MRNAKHLAFLIISYTIVSMMLMIIQKNNRKLKHEMIKLNKTSFQNQTDEHICSYKFSDNKGINYYS